MSINLNLMTLPFWGGAQPHSQLYSGELNYRQIEKGLEVFESLVGYKVTNNFHQETSLYDQLPQLLKVYGLTDASICKHTLKPMVDVSKTGLIVTSVMVKNNSIAYRFYEAEGKYIQFRIFDAFKQAQMIPGKYKDLIIRMWGVSAYFVDLPRNVQDEFIERYNNL